MISNFWVGKGRQHESHTPCYRVHRDFYKKGVKKNLGLQIKVVKLNKSNTASRKITGGKENLLYGTQSQTCSAKQQRASFDIAFV